MCCKCTNPDEACGWPPRTVRATLAVLSLAIVFSTCSAVIIMLIIQQQYATAMSLIGALLAIIGSITGYYFGSHTATTSVPSVPSIISSITPDIENGIKSKNIELQGISKTMDIIN